MGWKFNLAPYNQWCKRNRIKQGFTLTSNHSYGTIKSHFPKEFTQHPEYIALVKGERKSNKFCTSNKQLQAIIKQYVIKYMKKNPNVDSMSLEPSDHHGWCECKSCIEMGSESDRALFLANIGGKTLREEGYPNKYIGMYAYYHHAPPPSIKVDPNVIISVANGLIRGPFSFEEIIKGWKAKGAQIGVYDYFSVVVWDRNLPAGAKTTDPWIVARDIKRYHDMGARFLDCESGDAWGPSGPAYYIASRIMWDINEVKRVDELMDEFISLAFGKAKSPMASFYKIIREDKRRTSAGLTGLMYRLLDEAQMLESDKQIHQRLNQLILYTRYIELYQQYSNTNNKEAKAKLEEQFYRYLYQIRKTSMVHTFGIWSRKFTIAKSLIDHPFKNNPELTDDDISAILKNGIKNNSLDIGVEEKQFSRTLIPATALKLNKKKDGFYPREAQIYQNYYLWINKPGTLNLKVNCKKVWNNHPHSITLKYNGESVSESKIVKPDSKDYMVKLATKHSGLHYLKLRDGSDFSRITWPNIPVVIESGLKTKHTENQFGGPWTLYFYVPKNCKYVAGWAERIAHWAPRISGELLDADGNVLIDFSKQKQGWFKAAVAKGQAGKIWTFKNCVGQRLLATVPPYLVINPDKLLLPKEVIEADR